METTVSLDLGHVARELNLPVDRVQRTLELLDEGNTVPFITRFRKDQTGGLEEEQIRAVQSAVKKLRLLADRKLSVLKSVESQGKLTPEFADQVRSARTLKFLEDLYLPFKQKKQTLATLARQRGLEPLANDIYMAAPSAENLEDRAAEFVSPDNKLGTTTDVLEGVRHILAEQFGERADLRGRLRRVFVRTGKLISVRIEPTVAKQEDAAKTAEPVAEAENVNATDSAAPSDKAPDIAVAEHADGGHEPLADDARDPSDVLAEELGLNDEEDDSPETDSETNDTTTNDVTATDADASAAEEVAAESTPTLQDAEGNATVGSPATASAAPIVAAPVSGPLKAKLEAKKAARAAAREAKKKKKQKLLESAFKDYYNYQEPLNRVPPHRILAINRGERGRVLRVKIEADVEAMTREAEELLIPANHPHAEFLKVCVRDALNRLVLPSLERDLRREMTEKAETHAVDVFVCNLRKLLLQPPVRGRRVLAIDPGFRSGCKLVALDEFGNLLGHGMIHVIGSDQHLQMCRSRLVDIIQRHNISVLAVGNGTACRETEQFVAEILGNELKGKDICYVVVNEAGASVYSTSPLGREELPKHDATVRGAVSIGRRLLDPLSELVKINPSNIGVGLYQHDVKLGHLRDSLDDVVESCVNYVGVDVNTASPALLRYVSGLNQLTARRLYEYRLQHGPFRNREQFKQVPGFGDSAFVQSAGFLKINGGDNPLDSTWIHPESYEVARKVLERIGATVDELAPPVPAAPPAAKEPEAAEFGAVAEPTAVAAAPNEAASAEGATADDSAEATSETVSSEPAPAESAASVVEASSSETVAVVEEDAATSATEAEPPTETSVISSAAARREALAAKLAPLDVAALAQELGVGVLLLDDIVKTLARPDRDPREDLPPPIFRRGIMKLDDLAPGMELSGTVLNVVDFGAFVDIGLSDSALVHISRLADRFIKDPHEVVSIGDVLKVWVIDVDKQRRRVSLTAIKPGTEKPHEPRPQRPPRGEQGNRPPRPPRGPQQRPAGAPQTQGTGAGASGGDNQGAPGAAPPRRPDSRPRFGGGGGGGMGGGGRGPEPRRKVKPPKYAIGQTQKPHKPKPVRPITKGMIEGSEPMKTFSDLLQFYQKKKEDGDPTPPANG